jgi:PAS domain S-box-containing protein
VIADSETDVLKPSATIRSAAASRAQGLIGVDAPEARLSPITSPEAFEALFGSVPDLLCVRDLRGKLIRLNPSWPTLLGFPLRDLHGAPLLDLVHPEDVWATHDIMHGVSDERMVLGFSNRYRMLDGGYRRFEWTARRFGDYVFGLGRQVAG